MVGYPLIAAHQAFRRVPEADILCLVRGNDTQYSIEPSRKRNFIID